MKIVLKQPLSILSKLVFGIPLLLGSLILVSIKPFLFVIIPICVLFLGANYDYIINKDLNNYLKINFFSFSIIKFKKKIIVPKYISLFEESYKSGMGYGFHIPFGEDRFKMFTVKFFNEKEKETVFKSNSKEDILRLGKDLSLMLSVELYNTLK